jgi:hypothetical protein
VTGTVYLRALVQRPGLEWRRAAPRRRDEQPADDAPEFAPVVAAAFSRGQRDALDHLRARLGR